MEEDDLGFFNSSDVDEFDYKADQQKWRDAGWDAYNSDYVDEFPSW